MLMKQIQNVFIWSSLTFFYSTLANVSAKKKPQVTRKSVGFKKRPFVKPQVQDARQKLIQKKRSNVKDARDVLAKIAKGQDARNKLNKIRQRRNGAPLTNGNVKVIGQNILQKIDRNGKISLVTNKTKPTTGMNVAIQKELGLISQPKKTVVRRTMPSMRVPQTVNQTIEVEPTYGQIVTRNFDSSLYKWAKPGLKTTASQLIGSLENRTRMQSWQNFPVNK